MFTATLKYHQPGTGYQIPEVESRTQGSRPRTRTAFPRTDPLEAKDRNARGQGPRTEPQVFSKKKKKKGLQKSFSGILQFFGVARIFDWGAQTTNDVQRRHQRFSNEELFVGQRYRRMEDLKSLFIGT